MSEFVYDEAAAERAVGFFEDLLVHVKGEWAGEPIRLAPWQADDIIRTLFGWKRSDGTRRYRTVYVEIPRKNGKSTLAAGLALYLLVADGEPGAEVYSAAADRSQAGIVFGLAKAMVESCRELAGVCKAYARSIVIEPRHSSYHVLSADVPTKHGLNAHGVIFDELHAQPNRDLWDVLTTSTGSRRQPVVLAITTAGYDRHSICWEVHDYAVKVRDGVIEDDAFLPVIYAAEEGDDWQAPATWAKANPNLGVSVKPEYLEREAKRAREVAAYENTFKRLHLNLWTEQATRWLPMESWDACAGEADADALRGQRCFAGLDLSSTTDLSALVLFFPAGGQVLAFYWIPEEKLRERSRRDRVPYGLWASQGLLDATPGNVVDYAFIRSRLNALAGEYEIAEVAYDPWGATKLVTELGDDGFTMVPFRQGFASMSPACKELETLVLGGQLRHGGHPLLRWNAANVAVRQDPAGNLKPDKAKSTDRIDGIVALLMAVDRATRSAAPAKSRWEDPDAEVITVG